MPFSNADRAKSLLLFDQFKEEIESGRGLSRSLNDKILIVDGLNTFIRCWAANPSINEDGLHTGGVSGFLKSIGYAIKVINPTRCIIVFDGEGGSTKRRKIYPEYKQHRKTSIRLNRSYEDLVDLNSEDANKTKQLVRVAEYLQLLPVNILIANGIEADDSIAYCANEYFKDSKVSIMSSDKDFIQLITDRVQVWSPTKKCMYGIAEVLRDYGIHPINYVLFRIMDGDASDNINGIPGMGIKTAMKCFPFLSEPQEKTVEDLVAYATENKKKYKIYERVIGGVDILKRNYMLMQLKNSIMSTISQLYVNECLDNSKIPAFDRYGIVKLITEDKMWNNIPNYQGWFNDIFKLLNSFKTCQQPPG